MFIWEQYKLTSVFAHIFSNKVLLQLLEWRWIDQSLITKNLCKWSSSRRKCMKTCTNFVLSFWSEIKQGYAMETLPEAVVFPVQTSPKFVGTDNYKVSVPWCMRCSLILNFLDLCIIISILKASSWLMSKHLFCYTVFGRSAQLHFLVDCNSYMPRSRLFCSIFIYFMYNAL